MEIWVFGNPDLPQDARPLAFLPALKKEFPQHHFVLRDPNEEWQLPDRLVILDTVVGLDHVTIFHNLASFKTGPRVTMHDFDAFTNLLWLEKMNKLPPLTIIGVPSEGNAQKILADVTVALRQRSA